MEDRQVPVNENDETRENAPTAATGVDEGAAVGGQPDSDDSPSRTESLSKATAHGIGPTATFRCVSVADEMVR